MNDQEEVSVPGQLRTLGEEIKVDMEAVVLQPRHTIKKVAIVKLAAHSSHRGGATSRQLMEFATCFAGQATSAVGSSKKKGPRGEMRSREEKRAETMIGEEGKGKKDGC